MQLENFIKDKFEGKRLISINNKKVNEIISKVELNSGHLTGAYLLVYLKNKTKLAIFPTSMFELEESGM